MKSFIFWGVVLVACHLWDHSVAASASPSNTNTNSKRPPFVAHLTDHQLSQARALAAQRHEACVEHALSGFNVDAIPRSEEEEQRAASTHLKEYDVKIPTKLLDFDEELPKKIYVTDPPFLSQEECAHVIQLAEDHFAAKGQWSKVPSGQYGFCGFYIKEVPTVHEWFVKIVKQRFFPLLQRIFPDFCDNAADLLVDNSYLFKYAPETGRRTDVHTDEGCLSFTIALNSKDDFEGGGTWFEGLSLDENDDKASSEEDTPPGAILEMDVGQINIRPSSLKHMGNAITSGTRYIIGGFVLHRSKAETIRMLTTGNPPQETEAALEAALALNPDNDATYTLLASHEYAKGNVDKSIALLEYCLEQVNPRCGQAAYDLARQYMEKDRHIEAMDLLKICLAADPMDVDAMVSMAEAAGEVGDTETEKEYLNRVVQTPKSNDQNDSVKAQAYRNLGLLHKGQGDIELDYYCKSLAVEDNYEARYSLGRALAQAGQLTEALESFRAAVTLAAASGDAPKENSALKGMHIAARRLITQQDQNNTSGAAVPSMEQRMVELMGEENFRKVQLLAMQQFRM
jgi:tetratricopeptide (TPR) repeat protein